MCASPAVRAFRPLPIGCRERSIFLTAQSRARSTLVALANTGKDEVLPISDQRRLQGNSEVSGSAYGNYLRLEGLQCRETVSSPSGERAAT